MVACLVRRTSQLSAASRQPVLRSRHALPAVSGALAESSSDHPVGASTSVHLSDLHRHTPVSGWSVLNCFQRIEDYTPTADRYIVDSAFHPPWDNKTQISLRYLVADRSEAGRRPATSWNFTYHLAR